MIRDDEVGNGTIDDGVGKVEGVFVEPQGTRDVSRQVERAVPDEFVEDPYTADDHPGTPDDIPYSMGVETPDPADQHVVAEGATSQAGPSAGEEREQELGRRDERELWARQKALIEEDEKSGLRLDGFSDEEAQRVAAAMGDDAAEAMPDYPGGTSATGNGNEPDHGGFPERS